MPTLTFNGESYAVHHAVKGADYIHGYDAAGVCVAAFEGCSSFDEFTYDGDYMEPSACLEETCNGVRYVGGKLKTLSGEEISVGGQSPVFSLTMLDYSDNSNTYGVLTGSSYQNTYHYFDKPVSLKGYNFLEVDFVAQAGFEMPQSFNSVPSLASLTVIFSDENGNNAVEADLFGVTLANPNMYASPAYTAKKFLLRNGTANVYFSGAGTRGYRGGIILDAYYAMQKGFVSTIDHVDLAYATLADALSHRTTIGAAPNFETQCLKGFKLTLSNVTSKQYYVRFFRADVRLH